MDAISREDFKKVYKKEKVTRISRRMLAVYDVKLLGMNAEDVAEHLMQCPNWVHKWVERFDADGLHSSPGKKWTS